MKHTKKLLSFLLIFSMLFSLGNGFIAKAETTLTVTLRIEKDASTELAPVSITLTDEDKRDFGIGLGTETLTPLHALAKYLEKEKQVTDADMGKYIIASPSQYGLFVTGISLSGDGVGSPSTASTEGVYWQYSVNDTYASVSMDAYELKDNDSVVIYGLWSPYPAADEVLYATFDQSEYSVRTSESLSVTLTGSGTDYDESGNAVPYSKAINGATVTAMEIPQTNASVTEDTYMIASTDEEGKASLTFGKPGTYALSGYRMAADKVHYDISRPYAVVTVTDKTSAVPTATASAIPTATAPAVPSATAVPTAPAPTATPDYIDGGEAKIYSPTKVKAKVKKSKAAKKKITVSWKKARYVGDDTGRVSGYEAALSKKKKKGYKKIAKTTKTKITFKRKKGIYYVKVRAYKKHSDRTKYGPYSAPVKIKVK